MKKLFLFSIILIKICYADQQYQNVDTDSLNTTIVKSINGTQRVKVLTITIMSQKLAAYSCFSGPGGADEGSPCSKYFSDNAIKNKIMKSFRLWKLTNEEYSYSVGYADAVDYSIWSAINSETGIILARTTANDSSHNLLNTAIDIAKKQGLPKINTCSKYCTDLIYNP